MRAEDKLKDRTVNRKQRSIIDHVAPVKDKNQNIVTGILSDACETTSSSYYMMLSRKNKNNLIDNYKHGYYNTNNVFMLLDEDRLPDGLIWM